MVMAANTWIYFDTVTKNTSCDLSNVTYKEIYLAIKLGSTFCAGVCITPLSETYNIYNGYSTQNPRCIQVVYNSSTSTVNIRYAFNEALRPTYYTDNMEMDVYYR